MASLKPSLHLTMRSLTLSVFAAGIAADVGPCFGWNAISLQPYGLLSADTALLAAAIPSGGNASVQITAAVAMGTRDLAPSLGAGDGRRSKRLLQLTGFRNSGSNILCFAREAFSAMAWPVWGVGA
jgi:hypothetical protein